VVEVVGDLKPASISTKLAFGGCRRRYQSGDDPTAVSDMISSPIATRRRSAGLGDPITDLFPAARISRIRIPIEAMHSRQDPAAPPSESALMIASLEPPVA
jgi:hypothetical protein